MGIDHNRVLALLQAHRGRWMRPATNAQLLSHLFLALKGYAIAVRDSEGNYMFRLAERRPVMQPAAIPIESCFRNRHSA